MFKRLKCLFTKHDYDSLGCVNSYSSTDIKNYNLLVCKKCNKVKVKVQETNNVDVIYRRWEKLAGIDKPNKTLKSLDGYAATWEKHEANEAEMKHLLKSAHKLKLKKMKIDVKSFEEADEALAKERLRSEQKKETK